MSGSLTPAEKRLRAQSATHRGWANTKDRTARTQPGRDAFLVRFEREVDPDGSLPADERRKRAENARKSYMAGLAFKASRSRRRKKSKKNGAQNAVEAGPEPTSTITDHRMHPDDLAG